MYNQLSNLLNEIPSISNFQNNVEDIQNDLSNNMQHAAPGVQELNKERESNMGGFVAGVVSTVAFLATVVGIIAKMKK